MSANKAFIQWLKRRKESIFDHNKDCPFEESPIPIDMCNCNCYEQTIFRAGYFAARGEKNKCR